MRLYRSRRSTPAVPAQDEAGLTVAPWALHGAVPALGRTPALRGFPGGIGLAGPGWPGGLAEEDQSAHEAWPDAAAGTAPAGAGQEARVNGAASPLPGLLQPPGRGTGAGRGNGAGPDGRGRERWPVRAGDPGLAGRQQPGRAAGGRVPGGTGTRDDGRSVWQRALSVWRAAGLEWQSPVGGTAFDVDLQRTEPIPVVPAADVSPATARPAPEQPPGAEADAGPDSPGDGTAASLGEPAPETGRAPNIAAEAAASAPAASAPADSAPADSAPAKTKPAGGERAAGAVAAETAAMAAGAVADQPVVLPEPAPGPGTPEPVALPPSHWR